jgi:hypothetical protein
VRQITRDREELHYAWMWQVSENQAKLFDRREKIEVFPISSPLTM